MPADELSPPLPGMASLTARQFGTVLSKLEGRAKQALALRLLEGRSRTECASFFGISPRAFDVMLLRAARALELSALPGPPRPLLAAEEERIQAEVLARTLEDNHPLGQIADPEVRRLGQLLRHLRDRAGEIRREIELIERESESSPRSRWALWGRRLMILLLIAVALYLYQRERATEREPRGSRPRFVPRPPMP